MYNQKAFEILTASINSAVFIDDKARDFYSENVDSSNEDDEAELSVNLFETFKQNGKNLTVHKFKKENIDDENLINYLFSGKDLILLDWELESVSGQEYSLQLLSKSIELPYINFCCIYSRSKNFNDISHSLIAYFSGLTKKDFEIIRTSYEYISLADILDFWQKENDIEEFFDSNEIKIVDFPIPEFRNRSFAEILNYIYVALNSEKFIIPEEPVNKYDVIHSSDGSFIINNTFVLTLKKDKKTDSDYNSLITRISNEIVKNESSFFQLLGLEMQTVFNTNERFLDDTILKSSTEALFSFRNHLGDDKTFGIIIKKLLLEQATLKLRTAKLKLLDSDFLENYSKTIQNPPSIEDIFHLNTFYNSVTVKSLNSSDIPNLNFGDVFKDTEDTYYLCITALCDCYYPDKIDRNFYFVKGTRFENIETALRLGDTAFLSFLPDGEAVFWGKPDGVSKPKIKKSKEDSDEAHRIKKLQAELELYKSVLYRPLYVKPKVYNVEDNKLNDNKIRIWDITNNFDKTAKKLDQKLNYFEVEYITTLRNDYAQRIANHAFGHPARVGVDFVKI